MQAIYELSGSLIISPHAVRTNYEACVGCKYHTVMNAIM